MSDSKPVKTIELLFVVVPLLTDSPEVPLSVSAPLVTDNVTCSCPPFASGSVTDSTLLLLVFNVMTPF